MKIKDMKVELCERNDIKQFVEHWHYSKSINGLRVSYCFKLMYKDELIGAMIYGGLAMANQYKKYVSEEHEILELRRLCCVDSTPKNTESYFIGATLKYLAKNTEVKLILSYADPYHGHEGIIYKATNFKKEGLTAKGKIIRWGDKTYHDKTIRTKYKGELKPYAKKVKEALENGEAFYENTPSKIIYTLNLSEHKMRKKRYRK